MCKCFMYINYEIYFKKSTEKRIQCLTNVADRCIIMETNKNIIKKGYEDL